MKLIAGLGNLGSHYELTKHNVGFLVVDLLAEELRIPFTWHKARALVGSGRLGADEVLLVKPQTYMNLSGEAVAPLARRYGITGPDLVVIHDDIDLSLGRLRIKYGGSDGGHRGVRSIIMHLGVHDFTRIKIGIGRPPEGEEPAEWVLAPFEEASWDVMQTMLIRAAAAVREMFVQPLEEVMNLFNRPLKNNFPGQR